MDDPSASGIHSCSHLLSLAYFVLSLSFAFAFAFAFAVVVVVVVVAAVVVLVVVVVVVVVVAAHNNQMRCWDRLSGHDVGYHKPSYSSYGLSRDWHIC